jgi:hypothetical protein
VNKIVSTFAALATLAGAGHAQLVLDAGDTWIYPFSDLPKTGSVSAFTSTPSGMFEFTLDNSTFQNGDMLLYEMFETDTSELPICSGTLTSAPAGKISCERDFAWQDLQGAIRLSMLAGSVTVDSVSLEAIVPGVSLTNNDVHSATFVPAPEPSSTALICLALCAGLIRRPRTSCNAGLV